MNNNHRNLNRLLEKNVDIKAVLAKEYTEGIIQKVRSRYGEKGDTIRVAFNGSSVQRSFEKGWDAAVNYLAKLPLNRLLEYFNEALEDVTMEEVIEENKDVLKRLKNK